MVLQFLEGKRKWVQWLQVAIIGRDDLAHQLIGKDLKILKLKAKIAFYQNVPRTILVITKAESFFNCRLRLTNKFN